MCGADEYIRADRKTDFSESECEDQQGDISMENETQWDKIRDAIKKATEGIDPERLIVCSRVEAKPDGSETIVVKICET